MSEYTFCKVHCHEEEMAHQPVTAIRRFDWDALQAPGDFMFTTGSPNYGIDPAKRDDQPAGMIFVCPCGCKTVRSVTFNKSEKPHWTWDGNLDKPSLQPSLKTIGGCKWHGFLIAGVFSPCGDSGQ